MNQSTPGLSSEIKAYNRVRFRLIELAKQHPEILEVHIAKGDRMCRNCKRGPVQEYDGSFRCRSCEYVWTEARPVWGYL